jgi:hypothetical protein
LRPRIRFIFILLPSRFPIASPANCQSRVGLREARTMPQASRGAPSGHVSLHRRWFRRVPCVDIRRPLIGRRDPTRAHGTCRIAAVPTTAGKLTPATLAAKRFFCGTGLRWMPAYAAALMTSARSMPARSARQHTDNSWVAASRPTSSACPHPTSNIATPPGASKTGSRGRVAR